jgi:hypothetical protein
LVDKTVNAGVTAQQGFALQRNMALFIILDSFTDKFENQKYFLSLEHLEDIIYCFLNDAGESVSIETYQSKKKSTGNWGVNQVLAEVVVKILETGMKLIKDPHPKSVNYKQSLYFASNSTIHLKKQIIRKKPLPNELHSEIINEQNSICTFSSLDFNIQTAIKDAIKAKYNYKNSLPKDLERELDNLSFLFIDFARVNKEQENQLRGKLSAIFANKINDHQAALDTLFALFKQVELTYNQKSLARLSDQSKIVESTQIDNALDIITTKSKAFVYWRNEQRAISEKLGIKAFEKDVFAMKFESAFDLFKSYEEAAHQVILNFVKENYKSCHSYQEEGCVYELLELFTSNKTTSLDQMSLKATIYAAYFEATYKMEV